MRKISVANLFLVFLLSIGLLLSGCGGGSDTESDKSSGVEQKQEASPEKARDTVRIAIPTEPSTMDVQYPDDGNMRLVTENVVEGLLAMDGQTLKPLPALATEVTPINDTTWQLTLRQGVKFHNGNPFNADDVVFSINRQLSDELNSDIRGYWESFDTVKKISDYEVEITTKGADPNFKVRLTLLKIMDQEWVEANTDQVPLELIGTGPYKITEWKRGQSITIEANEDYWGPKPLVKKAIYRFIEEDATRAQALKAGEVDVATNMLPEYVSDLPKVKTVDGLEFSLLRLNAIKGVMKDVRLRQAASYAVDKEALAEALYLGYASVAQGQVFKPNYIGYNPDLKPYPYDPEKAKDLMAEAGYKGEKLELVGERGRWLKDGEQIEAIAQMLRAVGFNVEVKMLSFQQWLRVLFDRERAPDMIFTFHSNDIFEADRTFSTYVHTKGPGSSYPDTLDAKIEMAQKEMDLEKRNQIYREIGQAIYDDPAWISLINIQDIYGMQEYVEYEPRQDMRLAVFEMKLK